MLNFNNRFMRKKSFIRLIRDTLESKISVLCIGITALLFCSCAQDGFDEDEKWETSVRDTQLESPAADDISIAASADETKTVITWPVVHGAGGYICSVFDISDPDNPVVVDDMEDTLVDGCTLSVTREEDVIYRFSIRTAGNEDLNNTGSETASIREFSSFTPTYTTIPDGVDLYQWFQDNPIPEGAEADAIKAELYDGMGLEAEEIPSQMLNYDLVPGGEYYLSQSLDFLGNRITLRSSDKNKYSKLKIQGESTGFSTYAALSLKYIDIDCSEMTKALIQLSASPSDEIKDLVGTKGAYFVEGAIRISGCNIDNLRTSLITNNKIYYVVRNFIVDNSVVKLNKTTNSSAIIDFQGAGYVTSYLINKSTIYDIGNKDEYFFSQYGGRPKDLVGEAGTEKQIMAICNSTLYHVSYNKKFSNQREKGQKYNEYRVTNSIIVDCGMNQFIPGLIEQTSENPKTEYLNNTYYYDGQEVSAKNTGTGCDNSGTAIKDDPGFANPAAGDFTVSGAGQLDKKTGDPRWLP